LQGYVPLLDVDTGLKLKDKNKEELILNENDFDENLEENNNAIGVKNVPTLKGIKNILYEHTTITPESLRKSFFFWILTYLFFF
jgi:hypothetical protein